MGCHTRISTIFVDASADGARLSELGSEKGTVTWETVM